MIQDAITFYEENKENFYQCLIEHIQICAVCIAFCIIIGVPLGYLCAKKEAMSTPLITAINAICTIPAIALFILLIPVLGLGPLPAVLVISVHSILTVVINTMSGIKNVPENVIESAEGMGLDKVRICFDIELPLAMPLIIVGIRNAAVGTISGATLAAYISAGGLGELVLSGISGMNYGELLLGGGTIVIIVLICDVIISIFQKLASRHL